ncbi:hypothetical protein CK203_037085 [Vitis vinifera]|uniref:Uncharacterized protein n=1 Tax=Vitis vinifera TaxID=29760 RepID=A0A438I5Y3_VITVI|nr:hypothetical protein CK203_037085 [Vitis vinifera]
MSGSDDHLAWKRPVSSEACKGLRTVGGFPFLTMGASVGFQSRFSSDRFSYLRSSLLYICSGLDISLITFRNIDTFDLVTVDQFVVAMASIQEAIASLGLRIDGQQA